MKTRLFFIGLFGLVCNGIEAQDVLYKQDVMPQSPEAAAFGKNITIPVGYSSGTPQISVPFGSVKSGNIHVPVSISYNASGIRVEEAATWVGLGWSLSAGGQITRTVRGHPDEAWNGYINMPPDRHARYVDSVHCRCASPSGESADIESELGLGQIDLEPDQYNFSIPGYSGEFYYNQDSAKYILIPFQNLLVETVGGGFRITTPDGTRYSFGGSSSCEEVMVSGTTASYIDGVSESPVAIGSPEHTTSWMLTNITDVIGNSVELEYQAELIITFSRGGERAGPSFLDPGFDSRRQSFILQYLRKPVIQKISGESGNIYFKRSAFDRSDMPDSGGVYGTGSLDTIVITNGNNEVLRSFHLSYGYFTSASYNAGSMLNIASYGDIARKRLYLKSVNEKNGSESIPAYEFTYNETELPSRLSNSQDYWGYYNGKSNIYGFMMPRIPQLAFYPWDPDYNEDNDILPPYGQYLNSQGSDRRIDTNYSQARTLTKMKYPTGGSTEYFYEANDASIAYYNIHGGMEPPDMKEKSYTLSLMSNPIPSEPPYPLYFTGTFNVTYPATTVKVTPTLPTCTTYADASCKMLVKIKRLPDSTELASINTTNVFQTQLPTGQYLVEVFIDGSPDDYPLNFNVLFQWGERADSLNFKVGGLRVKKIVSTDSVGKTLSRTYRYRLPGGTESSGILEGCPTYKVHDKEYTSAPIRQYYASNSILPITQEGKTVRYSFVTEFYDKDASSYKSEYTFTSGLSNSQQFGDPQTGAPILSWNWQNNLLKRKQDYEKTGPGTYRPISDQENFFQFYQPLTHLYGLYGPQIISFNVATEWYLPDSTINISYAYPGGSQTALQTTSKTIYNNRFLPALVRTTNSKGEAIHNKTKYPSDYNDVSGYNIATLLSKYIIGIPIKQETSVNGKVRAGNIIKYNEWGQPLDGYSYENATLSDTVSHNKNTVLESNYNLKTSLRYDIDGNLKQMNNYKSGPVTYVWDYQTLFSGTRINELPVAAVQNADSSDVAYCSFEAESKGNWTFTSSPTDDASSPMGKKCHYLTGFNLVKTGLTSGKTYIVSYWSKNGAFTLTGNPTAKQGKTLNGWTLYEYEFTGTTSMTISGTGYIDEVRLYPKGSMMISYAYKFGYGIISQCDPANRISYYEYDDLQRLTLVRNEDRQILKKICYNYTGQPVNCGVDTSAAWSVVSSVCQQNNGINTGYMVVTEKNMNPSSATYNQTRTVIISSNGACFVCNTSNCSGNDKKCINNVCETGTKVCTGNFRPPGQGWKHNYHYVFSDLSTSATFVGEGICDEL